MIAVERMMPPTMTMMMTMFHLVDVDHLNLALSISSSVLQNLAC